MQIRVISLHQPSALLQQLRDLFPSADVQRTPGVDLRKTPLDELGVSHAAAHVLAHGRKWHHELTPGSVGLAHAVRNALEETPSQPLLLLEDDCVFTDPITFRDEVQRMLHDATFDVANFAMILTDGHRVRPSTHRDWWYVKGHFWQAHAMLYMPHGRRVVARQLRQPLEMQIDALVGSLAHAKELCLVGKLRNAHARQAKHPSTVQEFLGTCGLCDVRARSLRWQPLGAAPVWMLAAFVVGVLCGVQGQTLHRKGACTGPKRRRVV